MALPNKFTAQNIDNGVFVHFVKQPDGVYQAEWDAGSNNTKYKQFYDESTINTWLNTYLQIVKEEVNTMSYQKELPSKFEFVVHNDSFPYTAEVRGEQVFVTWYIDSELHSTLYDKSSIEAWIKDGSWKITKTLGLPVSEEGILSKVSDFAKETCADVIIDSRGYTIQYRDFDFVRVDSLEKLSLLIDTILAFHKVMHGKQ